MSRVRALSLLACCSLPGAAHAYSDAALFALPVTEAGGGGRYYTGSPADPLSCDSCHAGAAPPPAQLLGLPARYVPRATYELRIVWPASIEHAASVLEVTDATGRGAGSLALPGAESLVADELCEPAEAKVLAGQIFEAGEGRMIAASPDCGQSMLRVQWTAPDVDVGPVWLAGAVVASDHDGNFGGDGVTAFAEPVPPFGAELSDVASQSSCAAGPIGPVGHGACAWALLGLGISLIARRRARSRTRRRSGACLRSDPTTQGGD